MDPGDRQRAARYPRPGAWNASFDEKEFLNSRVMLAALLVIGVLSLVFELIVSRR
jgi:hypothetical protein